MPAHHLDKHYAFTFSMLAWTLWCQLFRHVQYPLLWARLRQCQRYMQDHVQAWIWLHHGSVLYYTYVVFICLSLCFVTLKSYSFPIIWTISPYFSRVDTRANYSLILGGAGMRENLRHIQICIDTHAYRFIIHLLGLGVEVPVPHQNVFYQLYNHLIINHIN